MSPSAAIPIAAILVASIACAFAQNPAPNRAGAAVAPAPQEQEPKKSATVRPNSPSKAHSDARLCLELPTNLQIMACAEKYR